MKTGIDIVFIPRLENKDDLARKILSEEEYKIYQECSYKDKFLAGRFAVREAFVKANKGKIDFHEFHNIRVLYDENHAPFLEYKGVRYEVSIAHDGDYAIAVCIME